jgi:hypothetical protein
MGFEPSTFCMASRTRGMVSATTFLQNTQVLASVRQVGCSGFHADLREIED